MQSTSKQIATNVVWKYLELFSVMGVQMVCTAIMARFLTPADYGVLGIVLVFSSLAEVFVNSGFSQTLIREKEVSRLDYSTILYFNVGIAGLLYVLLYFASYVIADFYAQPILSDVCKVAFILLPVNALSIIQMTKLQREVRFKKIFFISFTASLLSAIIAIILAYIYRNVWALVLQVVMTAAFRCLLLWVTSDFIPVLAFSVNTFKRYFQFSKNLMLSYLIGTLFNNIYSLVIGKAYSTTDLGYYSQASKISNLASQTTTQVVQTVTYPILSQMNNNGGDIKSGYKKIISITLILVGFVMALLLSCAQDFFELFMGSPTWRVAGTFFILMGIGGILYPLQAINQNILMVTGNSKTILYLEILRRSIMVVILLISLNFKIEIFVFSLSIYSIIQLFLNLYYCGKPINYTVKEQLKDSLPIFTRLAVMILLARGVGLICPIQTPFIRMLMSVIACAIFGFLLFWRQKDFQNLMMLVFSRIKL